MNEKNLLFNLVAEFAYGSSSSEEVSVVILFIFKIDDLITFTEINNKIS